jgi:hypothetical protein
MVQMGVCEYGAPAQQKVKAIRVVLAKPSQVIVAELVHNDRQNQLRLPDGLSSGQQSCREEEKYSDSFHVSGD